MDRNADPFLLRFPDHPESGREPYQLVLAPNNLDGLRKPAKHEK